MYATEVPTTEAPTHDARPGGTVLVTGAAGFVGRRVVPALRAAGWHVVATSRHGREDGDEVTLSVDDPLAVARAIDAVRPDVVVHLAGIAHRRAADDEYDRVNHLGTAALARALAERRPGATFVYAGSASVYGDGPFAGPVDERAAPAGDSAYAASKLRGERAALACAPAIRVIALRFPALYDRDWLFNVRKRTSAPAPLDALLLRLTSGGPLYSFCAVRTAVGAIAHAAAGRMPGGVYNVADAAPASQADVVRVVAHREPGHVIVPVPAAATRLLFAATTLLPRRARARARQAYHKFVGGLVLDTSRAAGTGFAPTTHLTDLLRIA